MSEETASNVAPPGEPGRGRNAAIIVIATIACGFALYFAKPILLPLVIALLLNLLFTPSVNRLARIGVPSLVSATLVIALIVGLLVSGVMFLSEPAKEWLREAPTSLRQVARDMEDVKSPLQEIRDIGEEVDELTEVKSKKAEPQSVKIEQPDALDQVMVVVPGLIASLWVTLTITFFLLAAGNRGTERILGFGKTWEKKRQIIRVSRQIHDEISRHLRTITVINIILGVVVGLVLWQLDIPNPELWGTMVAVLNFAPYLGAMVSTVVLALVSLMTFGNLAEAIWAPMIFLAITSLEGAVITPLVLGNRLSLSPLAVFLSVIAWGWLWGPAGALIAVPLMSGISVILTHSRSGKPFAKLIQH